MEALHTHATITATVNYLNVAINQLAIGFIKFVHNLIHLMDNYCP